MNIHNTELTRQHKHYTEIRSRLSGKTREPMEPAAKDLDEHPAVDSMRKQIDKLNREARFLRQCLRQSAGTNERVQELELALADAHARILAQAEMLKVQENSDIDLDEDNQPAIRRPVRVIAEEVLKDYPGITWDDIKGIRRLRNLINPRKACIRAVFEERKDLSTVKIGKLFGGRDHSTILHSIKTAP